MNSSVLHSEGAATANGKSAAMSSSSVARGNLIPTNTTSGRVRLQKKASMAAKSGSRWMDHERENLQAYDYLCRIGEAKQWLEECLQEDLGVTTDFEKSLRNGIVLAQLAQHFAPEFVPRIFTAKKLQFRHSDNINCFLRFAKALGLPENYSFELTDLYEGKNIPKVIYCIHALSFLLFNEGKAPSLHNLEGQLSFTDEEVTAMQRYLDQTGTALPNFTALSNELVTKKHLNSNPPSPYKSPVHVHAHTRSIDVSSGRSRASSLVSSSDEMLLTPLTSPRSSPHRRSRSEFPPPSFTSPSRSSSNSLHSLAKTISFEDPYFQSHRVGNRSERSSPVLSLRSTFSSPTRRRDALFSPRLSARAVVPEEMPVDVETVKLFQASCRGMLHRLSMVDVLQNLTDQISSIESVQAIARGWIARKNYELRQTAYEEFLSWIIALQSTIRGSRFREQFKKQVLEAEALSTVPHIQACIRGQLLRLRVQRLHERLDETTSSIITVQTASRAYLSRHATVDLLDRLYEKIPQITILESILRGKLVRQPYQDLLKQIASFPTGLHTLCRGFLARKRFNTLLDQLQENETNIILVQSLARGTLQSTAFLDFLHKLKQKQPIWVQIQSSVRGLLLRKRIDYKLCQLDECCDSVIQLQSLSRAYLVEKQCAAIQAHLHSCKSSITGIQSAVRAILIRDDMNYLCLQLEEQIPEIIFLQSSIRGLFARQSYDRKMRSFRENMENPFLAQPIFRGRDQGQTYRELAEAKNPAVMTVKRFVHMLDDNDFDFEEDVEIEKYRQAIVKQVRENELVEEHINQLDIKIALLVKNKISLDDVLKHHVSMKHGQLPTDFVQANASTVNSLTNSSRKYIDLYQCLLYALQTNPEYLTRYLERLLNVQDSESAQKGAIHICLKIFGFGSNRREEILLLKALASFINMEVSRTVYIEDVVTENSFWGRIFAGFTANVRELRLWKILLGKIHRQILQNDELDLEVNPITIFQKLQGNDFEFSDANPKPSVSVAMKNIEVRNLYVFRLRALRKLCQAFLVTLAKNMDEIPYPLCFLSSILKQALEKQYPKAERHIILGVVGQFIYSTYIANVLVSPDNYRLVDGPITATQRNNLTALSSILREIFSLIPRTATELGFFRPLAEFIQVSKQDVAFLLERFVDIADPETYYDFDCFEDLTTTRKPILYLNKDDILTVYSMVTKFTDTLAPSEDDPLREIVRQLGPLNQQDSDFLNLRNEIKLELNPRYCTVEDPAAQERALVVQTKRYILFIIRVQNGTSLLNILVKPVTDDDEDVWQTILEEDITKHERRGESFDESLIDLSFTELKYAALQNVVQLEALGLARRENQYQDIVNSIALDIRTKSRRRIQRQRELETARQTLHGLIEKREYLESQLKSYNEYIEQAKETLQSKKGKKKLLPFSKQYFHIRDLRKSGQVPKFGSFKYTAIKLYERGVLVSMSSTLQQDKLYITLSSDEVGKFVLQAITQNVVIPNGTTELSLDDLLEAQYNKVLTLLVFNGRVKLNTNMLLQLIFSKFYA
ncbi:hypothetical protein SJAG_04498 [Schizosaccharomyces japonicus yFS275]|uniref:Uncharacterized protein n=1 Tax=Schizosaccharomyces japonicus (strain yFS275 / FY16936) TaxID=402676 RepID=B6K6Z7_SCHJY|nr:hypothetical protein SJAG_04498 [Schizosaccharomyces japonicus yFS275]EEB09301.1 hypothetical protein SJAG_04498 [Schizosaccharomyces japonicus yFS275]